MTAQKNHLTEQVLTGTSPTIFVVGGANAKKLATRFDETATVVFASHDQNLTRTARTSGIETHCVDVGVASSLCPVAEGADAAVVTFTRDRRTLLAATLLRACCDIDTVVASVAESDYRDAFENAGIEIVDTQSLLLGAVREKLPLFES